MDGRQSACQFGYQASEQLLQKYLKESKLACQQTDSALLQSCTGYQASKQLKSVEAVHTSWPSDRQGSVAELYRHQELCSPGHAGLDMQGDSQQAALLQAEFDALLPGQHGHRGRRQGRALVIALIQIQGASIIQGVVEQASRPLSWTCLANLQHTTGLITPCHKCECARYHNFSLFTACELQPLQSKT